MLGCILFSCLWSDVMGRDPAAKEYLNIDVFDAFSNPSSLAELGSLSKKRLSLLN